MTTVFCVFIIIVIAFILGEASKSCFLNCKSFFAQKKTLIAVLLFSLLTGLRYNDVNTDADFLSYYKIIEAGDSHYYYKHIELFPRLFIDVIHLFNLPPSIWFILMSICLMGFILWAARKNNGIYSAWVFLWFIAIYLSFCMNVVRQGVALAAVLCAITCIAEKDWKKYILFFIIAFAFHRTSLIWSPLYFLTFLDWQKETPNRYLLIAIITGILMLSIVFVISNVSFLFNMMQMSDKVVDASKLVKSQDIIVGSGFGVIFRYLRWIVLFYYIRHVAVCNNNIELKILLSIFIIGVIMDPFTMHSIAMGRVALYSQFVEVLIYPVIMKNCRAEKDFLGYMFLMALFGVLFAQVTIYFSKWNFVFYI